MDCEHDNQHTEMVEPWPTSPQDTPQEYAVYVCDDCDETLEGDPAADRAEALADEDNE